MQASGKYTAAPILLINEASEFLYLSVIAQFGRTVKVSGS